MRHILVVTFGLLSGIALLLTACASLSAPTPTPIPTATPSPTPTPIPTVTPTFAPPTVAVQDGDSIRGCLERNLTPELLISLSQDDTTFTGDVMRTCLATQIPVPLVALLDPIIDDASQCVLDGSKTLSNSDLIDLASGDSARKDAIVSRVASGVVDCLTTKCGLDFLR